MSKASVILARILFISLLLWASVDRVGYYLKNQNREFQNVVVISGVMDSFKAVRWINTEPWCELLFFGPHPRCARFHGVHIHESGYYIDRLRVQLQGDPSRYVVDGMVFGGFDWENFRANEAVGNRVSLKVEGAELQGRDKRVRVIGLTSRLGTYLTPEVSLSRKKDRGFKMLLIGSMCGVFALFVLYRTVAILGIWGLIPSCGKNRRG